MDIHVAEDVFFRRPLTLNELRAFYHDPVTECNNIIEGADIPTDHLSSFKMRSPVVVYGELAPAAYWKDLAIKPIQRGFRGVEHFVPDMVAAGPSLIEGMKEGGPPLAESLAMLSFLAGTNIVWLQINGDKAAETVAANPTELGNVTMYMRHQSTTLVQARQLGDRYFIHFELPQHEQVDMQGRQGHTTFRLQFMLNPKGVFNTLHKDVVSSEKGIPLLDSTGRPVQGPNGKLGKDRVAKVIYARPWRFYSIIATEQLTDRHEKNCCCPSWAILQGDELVMLSCNDKGFYPPPIPDTS